MRYLSSSTPPIEAPGHAFVDGAITPRKSAAALLLYDLMT
jgi:hypothetical protein